MIFQSLTLLYTVIWCQQSLSAGNIQHVEVIQVWLDLLETRQLLCKGIISSECMENLSTNLDLFLFHLGVNLLVGTESGLMLLDRSGQGKVYPLINRRRFQQMDVLEGLNVLVTISGNVNFSMWFFLHGMAKIFSWQPVCWGGKSWLEWSQWIFHHFASLESAVCF